MESGTVLLEQHLVWRSRHQGTFYGAVKGSLFFGVVKRSRGKFSGQKYLNPGRWSKYGTYWSDHPLSLDQIGHSHYVKDCYCSTTNGETDVCCNVLHQRVHNSTHEPQPSLCLFRGVCSSSVICLLLAWPQRPD